MGGEQMEGERRTVTTPAGEITYTLEIKRVKNLNLRLRPDGRVSVSIPHRVPKSAADAFVQARSAWIFTRLSVWTEKRVTLTPPEKGEALPVLRASLSRMYPLVGALGVNMPELRVRFMTSRWGSCHWTRGRIVLNSALIRVPEPLMDYVTLHELVHFLHPDHGKGFYRAMDSLMGDWRERRAQLKRFRLEKNAPASEAEGAEFHGL